MDGTHIHPEAGDESSQAVPQGLPTPSGTTAVGHTRRRRRHHSKLGSSLRRNRKAAQVRKVIALVFLGLGVVGVSTYLARNSTAYEPVPTVPGN